MNSTSDFFSLDGFDRPARNGREILDDTPERRAARELESRQAKETAWHAPEPLPGALLPVKPYASEYAPATLAAWIDDLTERMQAPPDFIAVAAIVAAGSVIGRKIGIRPQSLTDWTEVPNVWGLAIGRPGAMKSPAMSAALAPVARLEADAAKAFEADAVAHKQASVAHKLRSDEAHDAARKAIKAGLDPMAALGGLAEPAAPVARRYLANDATFERLGEILAANPNGTLVFRDELVGLLRTLDREDQAAARGFYLTSWGGLSGYTFDRIGRGQTRIEGACLSLLGGAQPGRMASYVSDAVTGGAGDDGLVQRFSLTVWPDNCGEWRDVDRHPLAEPKQRAWDAFKRLDTMTPDDAEAEHDAHGGVPFLRLDTEAHAMFVEWRSVIEVRLRSGEMIPALESHLSKYRKAVPALALINHLADGGTGPVDGLAMARALAFAEYLESHAARLYASGTVADADTAQRVLTRAKRGELRDGFTARDMRRKAWAGLGDAAANQRALDILCECGFLRGTTTGTASTGGRPTTTFAINPAVFRD